MERYSGYLDWGRLLGYWNVIPGTWTGGGYWVIGTLFRVLGLGEVTGLFRVLGLGEVTGLFRVLGLGELTGLLPQPHVLLGDWGRLLGY